MSKLRISYYRMFCMVVALMILDKKLPKPVDERIKKLLEETH